MRTDRRGHPFLVIGENIHASRVLPRTGRRAVELPGGRVGIGFEDGGERVVLPVHPAIAAGRDFAAGKVRHVASAIRWGLDGGEHAQAAAAYIGALAALQETAGADWLDLNADEAAADPDTRAQAIAWLVTTVEAAAGVPVSVASSDAAVIVAGAAASGQPRGRLLLNSASLERPEVLDIAQTFGASVVLACSSPGGMPATAEDRVRNGIEILELALARQIPADACLVDPLVLPVAVKPDAPASVLEAARQLRAEYGVEIHLTGGLSNVSSGMPARRVLNEAFIDLAAEAGIDCGIVDPVASDLGRAFGASRDTDAYRLASDLLLGRDPNGGAYKAAFRAGRLEGAA